MAIKDTLIEIRERNGLTQAEMAERLFVTRQAVSRWECGDTQPGIDALKLNGASDIAFVIGGSDGVSAAVRHRADETLSFGPITLPHNLARVVLLEQLYRAQKISRGEPYHK